MLYFKIQAMLCKEQHEQIPVFQFNIVPRICWLWLVVNISFTMPCTIYILFYNNKTVFFH